ncbi:SHOCT domain-containing protein [Halovivax limisalsi]|uniref:SHOCT domain-containing protein n=1 Tax=Halovivax limisalsi TaxID=1453760 RepID=UPI001FFCE42C|nr:SHOCT domain-containing protein [Halovivax limisalsi]
MASRHWLYFAGAVLCGLATVAVGLLGVVDALSVLSSGVYAGEEFVLLAMLGEAIEWLVALSVFGVLAVIFLAATVVSVLRNTLLHRDDRLVTIVDRLEREYPALRQFDVASTVEPTTEDRKAELKERYVDDEISEAEFEREMERLMDDSSTDHRSRSRTERTADRDW